MLDVFINDPLALGLLSGLVFIFAGSLAVVGIRRYEFTILLIVVSPWLSSLFIPNTTELYYTDRAATLGSYMRISVLVLAGLVGFVSFFKFRWQNHKTTLPEYILLGLFTLIALVSSVYSIERDITFIRSISFILLFLFLLGFSSWLDSDEKIQSSLNILFWIFAVIIHDAISLTSNAGPGQLRAARVYICACCENPTASVFP